MALAAGAEIGVGPGLPDVFGRIPTRRIGGRNRIRPLGKWTSWTVLRAFVIGQNRPVEQRLGGRVVALADEAQIFLPVAHRREMDGAALLGAVAALVEAVEDGDGEARVVAMAGERGSVGAGDRFRDPLKHLLMRAVGHRAAGELVRGIPGGGEHAVALRESVGRRAAHPRVGAGGARQAGVGDGLQEELAQEGSPAVATDALGRAALVGVEEVADQPAALLFGGDVFVLTQHRLFGSALQRQADAGIIFHPASGRGVRG